MLDYSANTISLMFAKNSGFQPDGISSALQDIFRVSFLQLQKACLLIEQLDCCGKE